MSITEKIKAIFVDIKDPRQRINQLYSLESLLFIAFCAVISGYGSFHGMEDYAVAHEAALREVIDLPAGQLPTHDTFNRLFAALDYRNFEKNFIEFTQTIAVKTKTFLAFDGKTIRNAGSPLQIVSAWCASNHMVLAQTKVCEKSNEITAIPLLLDLLEIAGAVVTIDAMGCQREICGKILDKKGHYVIALKGNQGTLFEDVKTCFHHAVPDDITHSWEEWDKGHGRIEQRQCLVISHLDWLQERHLWPGLNSIALVKSKRLIGSKETTESRYYISSLEPDAALIGRATRIHWEVENNLHWCLDVTFNEDKACITTGHAPENMSIMRKIALNLLNAQKTKRDPSLKSMQRRCAMSFPYLMKILSAF